MIEPTRQNCFTPRLALSFLKAWNRKNKFEYNFFHTPKGPIIFYKDKKAYWIKRSWISDSFNPYYNKQNFLLNLSEDIAKTFGYIKGKNDD